MLHDSSLLKRPFFHTDDIFGSLVKSSTHTHTTNRQTNKQTNAHRHCFAPHSPGVTDIWQLLQITALPEDPFPKLNSNNSENEEHEKTKKQHIP